MSYQHASLAEGQWFKLSFYEQMGNIGSEVGRARKWQHKNIKLFESSFFRAMELLSLTIDDKRWNSRLSELCRVKEVLGDAYYGGALYNSDFQSLEKYFYHFALAARNIQTALKSD